MAVPGADTEARGRLRMLLHGSETERDIDILLRPDPLPNDAADTGISSSLHSARHLDSDHDIH